MWKIGLRLYAPYTRRECNYKLENEKRNKWHKGHTYEDRGTYITVCKRTFKCLISRESQSPKKRQWGLRAGFLHLLMFLWMVEKIENHQASHRKIWKILQNNPWPVALVSVCFCSLRVGVVSAVSKDRARKWKEQTLVCCRVKFLPFAFFFGGGFLTVTIIVQDVLFWLHRCLCASFLCLKHALLLVLMTPPPPLPSHPCSASCTCLWVPISMHHSIGHYIHHRTLFRFESGTVSSLTIQPLNVIVRTRIAVTARCCDSVDLYDTPGTKCNIMFHFMTMITPVTSAAFSLSLVISRAGLLNQSAGCFLWLCLPVCVCVCGCNCSRPTKQICS